MVCQYIKVMQEFRNQQSFDDRLCADGSVPCFSGLRCCLSSSDPGNIPQADMVN